MLDLDTVRSATVSRLTTFRELLPSYPVSDGAMFTLMPEPATAPSMALLISDFREVAAVPPPTRMSDRLEPWKATAYLKPRVMILLRRGKLA